MSKEKLFKSVSTLIGHVIVSYKKYDVVKMMPSGEIFMVLAFILTMTSLLFQNTIHKKEIFPIVY